MSLKEIKALEQHWYEAMNKGKADAMAVQDRLCDSDYVFHRPDGMVIHGLKDYKNYLTGYYVAFPDLHFTIDDMVIEGDRAAVRFTFNGTHKGEFVGIPPTNKKVTILGFGIDRIAGGKFVDSWGMIDALGLMQQLGAVPMLRKLK